MSLFKNVVFASVITSISFCAQAADDAATKLTGVLTRISSMQADFIQQTADGKNKTQSQKGKMLVKRPGMFRWEVTEPANQLVVTTGKLLWIYDPDLMQATRQKLDDQVGNTPALLLSGDPKKINEAFVVSEEKAAEGEQTFVLKPHGNEALFEILRVRFKGNELYRMQLVDTLGQTTDIRFENIKLNPSLSNSQFDFKPPKGVDVIDQM